MVWGRAMTRFVMLGVIVTMMVRLGGWMDGWMDGMDRWGNHGFCKGRLDKQVVQCSGNGIVSHNFTIR
mgnify:CR=1 FL=1